LNSGADGFETTAPARSFSPNPWGLYNLCGNVWEWTSDHFRVRSLKRSMRALNADAAREARRVLKGGSFLCHRSYCYRYRIAARIGNPPDSSTTHIGLRLAYDA
jgi:formylglycine-generating enzyme required for sulfatase activity